MSILEKLAASQGRRDEAPNLELAREIAVEKNGDAVRELMAHLHNKSKDIQNDCIKVLYEIGALNPSLIAAHYKEFLALLQHKNNRLQWGAMTALDYITPEGPKAIYAALPEILEAANKGAVITRDHAVNILISLCTIEQYAEAAFELLNELLLKCPANQLPMYAEKAIPVINNKNKDRFMHALSLRINDIDKAPKRKRIEKVIKKIS